MPNANDWAFENGKEKIWYDENPSTQHVVLTSPMSRPRLGYIRKSTTNPREMDRVFNRVNSQEHEANEKFIEKLYKRGRENYDSLRSAMRDRLVSAATSNAEKVIIRASLKLMDEKDHKAQINAVHGLSAMQESEAPLPPERKRIM